MTSSIMTPTTVSPQDVAHQFRPPTRFLRIRTLLLGCIFSLSFVWSILLCIAIFVQWPNMNIVEHNMISIMLFIEFFTVILVPVLLATQFRLWLDAARFLLLFASHFGIAIWFACKISTMKCVASDEDICNSLILSILIFSWVIPILVAVYSCGLGYLYYRFSKATGPMPTATSSTLVFVHDVEKQQKPFSQRNVSFHTSRDILRASSAYAQAV